MFCTLREITCTIEKVFCELIYNVNSIKVHKYVNSNT